MKGSPMNEIIQITNINHESSIPPLSPTHFFFLGGSATNSELKKQAVIR